MEDVRIKQPISDEINGTHNFFFIIILDDLSSKPIQMVWGVTTSSIISQIDIILMVSSYMMLYWWCRHTLVTHWEMLPQYVESFAHQAIHSIPSPEHTRPLLLHPSLMAHLLLFPLIPHRSSIFNLSIRYWYYCITPSYHLQLIRYVVNLYSVILGS